MKFSHKIIAASSSMLLITLVLLSSQQFFTIKNSVETNMRLSVRNIVEGVNNAVVAELEGRKSIARYVTELVEQDTSAEAMEKVLRRPELSNAFILVGAGMETDGKVISGDPEWVPDPSWDARTRPWYKDAKAKDIYGHLA